MKVEKINFENLDVDDKNDYETSFDDNKLDEDDSIQELLLVPPTSTVETHRKIIAMSLGSRKAYRDDFCFSIILSFKGEPNWMDDYRRWNSESGYFAGKNNNFLYLRNYFFICIQMMKIALMIKKQSNYRQLENLI